MVVSPRKKVSSAPPTKASAAGSQNIQVFVRCRPLNKTEKDAHSYSVVDTPNMGDVVVKEKQMSSHTKTYHFDRVFGPQSSQIDVYRFVVEPLITQVMQGYNCTVFAYGQTGTGKTYTMEGREGREDSGITWEEDPSAGIVPRAMAQLFDNLKTQTDAEYSVRVSYLELYNEEISDLLSPTNDTSRLRLYEDSTKKGSVIIQGLEEVQVHNKREVYRILEKGSFKRKTAETLMNAHSSRSHTVFTATIHLKEGNEEGEDVMRIGKLNLVDLAGSENIGRSGAVDKRAREAGNINQSLLTLGRVITSLVERRPHIPYRESKLTRLLQDSLGGRTKTSIIATISPAGINLEETLSTLEYAHRAKNIQNKPEVNQRLSKKAILKEYTAEMERLRRDLMANKERNGVLLSKENYQEMLSQIQCQQERLAEKSSQLKVIQEEMERKVALFDECTKQLQDVGSELDSAATLLKEKELKLQHTQLVLKTVAEEREEQKHLVSKHVSTEETLSKQSKDLLRVTEESSADLLQLHNKLDRTRVLESDNHEAKTEFLRRFDDSIAAVLGQLRAHREEHVAQSDRLMEIGRDQAEARLAALSDLAAGLDKMVVGQGAATEELSELAKTRTDATAAWTADYRAKVGAEAEDRSRHVQTFCSDVMQAKLNVISDHLTRQVTDIREADAKLNSEIARIHGIFTRYSEQNHQDLTRIRKAVNSRAEQNKTRLASLRQEQKALLSSETEFKGMMDTMLERFQQHSDLMKRTVQNVDGLTQNYATDTAKVVSTVNGALEAGAKERARTEQEVADAVQQTMAELNASIEAMNSTGGAVKSTAEEIGSALTEFGQEAVNGYAAAAECASRRLTEQREATSKFAHTFVEKSNEAVGTVDSWHKKITEDDLAAMTVTDRQHTEGATELVARLESEGSEATQRIEAGLVEQKDNVSTFVNDSLKEYVPTGTTPAPVQRSYPRSLAATSPHERILTRYRDQVANVNVAMRLPLEEEDEEESTPEQVKQDPTEKKQSTSRPLSRQNSVRGRKNIPVRNLSRETSGDRGKKVSPATGPIHRSKSDLASDAEDQENKDPQFVRPQAVSRPGAKRELRKPSSRNSSASRAASIS